MKKQVGNYIDLLLAVNISSIGVMIKSRMLGVTNKTNAKTRLSILVGGLMMFTRIIFLTKSFDYYYRSWKNSFSTRILTETGSCNHTGSL